MSKKNYNKKRNYNKFMFGQYESAIVLVEKILPKFDNKIQNSINNIIHSFSRNMKSVRCTKTIDRSFKLHLIRLLFVESKKRTNKIENKELRNFTKCTVATIYKECLRRILKEEK